MEARCAVFLDKDGTLIPDIPYNVEPDLITLNNGVIEGLLALQAHFNLFVVSNQSGVAKGVFGMEALEKVKSRLITLLVNSGINIADFYFCPHDPTGIVKLYSVECQCRKPRAGMLLKAARDYNLDLSRCWMIGDILNDVEAGKTAGCRSVLIDNGNETKWMIEGNMLRIPDFIAKDFLEATAFINQNKDCYV